MGRISALTFELDIHSPVTEAITSVREDSTLAYIYVMDDIGEVYATYDPGGVMTNLGVPALTAQVTVSDDVLHVSVPISYRGEVLGSLALGVSLDSMNRRIAKDRRYALLISLVILPSAAGLCSFRRAGARWQL